MVKKKKTNTEISTANEELSIEVENASEELEQQTDPQFQNMQITLEEILQDQKAQGYILKNPLQATLYINDQAKIPEYALLSSQTFDSSTELSAAFDLGEMESALLKGENLKVLCVKIGENNASIILGKTQDHTAILKKLQSHSE
jgi:hypothetical protein